MNDLAQAERHRAVALVALGRAATELGLDFDVVGAIRSGAPASALSAVLFSDVAAILMADETTFEVAAVLERARVGI